LIGIMVYSFARVSAGRARRKSRERIIVFFALPRLTVL
jgi:hypothetical protein